MADGDAAGRVRYLVSAGAPARVILHLTPERALTFEPIGQARGVVVLLASDPSRAVWSQTVFVWEPAPMAALQLAAEAAVAAADAGADHLFDILERVRQLLPKAPRNPRPLAVSQKRVPALSRGRGSGPGLVVSKTTNPQNREMRQRDRGGDLK